MDSRKIVRGIRQARTAATDKGVPLTLERVAACADLDCAKLREFAAMETRPAGCSAAAWEAIRAAVFDCRAELVEHVLTPKVSATGGVFLLKHDFGYADKAAENYPEVVFSGEEQLEE